MAVAVAILYVLHFTGSSNSAEVSEATGNQTPSDLSIAYVNSDSLLSNYDYFKELDQDTIGRVRARHTNGRPYFIFTGTRSPRKNLIRLIDAFDLVKKKHELEHQLLIVGNSGWKEQAILDRYHSSDNKSDIQLLTNVSDSVLSQ